MHVDNFRSCWSTTVDFEEHLTLLVGENDAGKSNIIDALRLAIPPATGRAAIYFDPERDLSYGLAADTPLRITRQYKELSPDQQALFQASLETGIDLVQTTVLRPDLGLHRRQRFSHLVGEAQQPDPELRDRIAHVYLPPLRDAARALDSAEGSHLADVFEAIASRDEIEEFELQANDALGQLADAAVASKVVQGVQRHLTPVTQPVRHRVIGLAHLNQRLRRLVRSLRVHMAAEGLAPADLLGSGLGYTNLLYIASVVLELERAREFDLTLLLVEEPEAHLQPQLQAVLLGYLLEQATLSATAATPDSLDPAGRVQVIATTHSPQLASAVSTSNVVVLRSRARPTPGPDERVPGSGDPGAREVEETYSGPERRYTETVAVSLASTPLAPAVRRKVDRYLDATRAALLFARQVILVEGIAEAILLRTFAEHLIFPRTGDDGPDGPANRLAREQFRAISVVPIGGVDFEPYVRILLAGTVPLCDRVVVVTDGDNGAGDRRRISIEQDFSNHIESGRLVVKVGATTLEADLFAAVANADVLREAYLAQHPRSGDKWDALVPANVTEPQERARLFSEALKDKGLDLGKGDFAHLLSQLVETSSVDLEVPDYLAEAIRDAILSPEDH